MGEMEAIRASRVREGVPDPLLDWPVEFGHYLFLAFLGFDGLYLLHWHHLRVHIPKELEKLTIDILYAKIFRIRLKNGLE